MNGSDLARRGLPKANILASRCLWRILKEAANDRSSGLVVLAKDTFEEEESSRQTDVRAAYVPRAAHRCRLTGPLLSFK